MKMIKRNNHLKDLNLQENIVKANQIKALSLMKEAQTLMKDSHDMRKTIGKEKKRIEDTK